MVFCKVCKKDLKNISAHNKTKTHLNKLKPKKKVKKVKKESVDKKNLTERQKLLLVLKGRVGERGVAKKIVEFADTPQKKYEDWVKETKKTPVWKKTVDMRGTGVGRRLFTNVFSSNFKRMSIVIGALNRYMNLTGEAMITSFKLTKNKLVIGVKQRGIITEKLTIVFGDFR